MLVLMLPEAFVARRIEAVVAVPDARVSDLVGPPLRAGAGSSEG